MNETEKPGESGRSSSSAPRQPRPANPAGQEPPGGEPGQPGEQMRIPGTPERQFQLLHQAGPLPTPDMLSEYERVLPGLAERIVQLTEKEAAHRHQVEDRQLDIVEADSRRAARLSATSLWISAVIMAMIIGAALAIALIAGEYLIPSLLTLITGLGVLFANIASLFKKNSASLQQTPPQPSD